MIECNVSFLILYIFLFLLKENYYICDKMIKGFYFVLLNVFFNGSLFIIYVFC